ncbi:NCS2 family permease [Candidatus Sumerlaeota bacterium]|nr:NCS2 family permease [Candidatus Sumerlaeota bacterium]
MISQKLDGYFDISKSGSSISVELRAGLTTFLTMAYILFVNPSILSNAFLTDPEISRDLIFAQLLTATALASAVGSLLMGMIARYPFALAPGMGLNAYFTYTVVLGLGASWRAALGAVLISGMVFVVISVAGIREMILRSIPHSLKLAVAAGIGMFLALIGLENSGVIAGHPSTLVTLGHLHAAAPLMTIAGLFLIAWLLMRRIPGAILIGIVIITLIAAFSGLPVYPDPGGVETLIPFGGFKDGVVAMPVWPVEIAFQADLAAAWKLGFTVIFALVFVDLFDTAGTLIGLSEKAGFNDEHGNLPRASRAFLSDALATTCGALLGTSTTTSYIESASGIEEGGRTGLTAVAVAALFLISIFFWPLASAIPACATAPALILIGLFMMGGIGKIDWSDYGEAIPAFIAIIAMPLTFSIANGISFGIIVWTVLRLLSGKFLAKDWLMALLAALLIARYIMLPTG